MDRHRWILKVLQEGRHVEKLDQESLSQWWRELRGSISPLEGLYSRLSSSHLYVFSFENKFMQTGNENARLFPFPPPCLWLSLTTNRLRPFLSLSFPISSQHAMVPYQLLAVSSASILWVAGSNRTGINVRPGAQMCDGRFAAEAPCRGWMRTGKTVGRN